MSNVILLIFCFATQLCAGAIIGHLTYFETPMRNNNENLSVSNTTAASIHASSESFNEDDELAKIAASCLSKRNYEELSGYIVGGLIAEFLGTNSIPQSIVTIGLTELRESLHLEPMPSWPYNDTDPSANDLASAPTVQAYYDLKEPYSALGSIGANGLLASNLSTTIKYFDKRFPSIRTIFRRRFDKLRRSDIQVLDRKEVDRMIEEYSKTHEKIARAMETVIRRHMTDVNCRNAKD